MILLIPGYGSLTNQVQELVFADNQQTASNDDGLAFDLNCQQIEFVDPNNTNIIIDQELENSFQSGQINPSGKYKKGNYGHNTDSFIAARVDEGDVYYLGVSDFTNNNYNSNHLRDRIDSGNGGGIMS